MKSRPLTPTFVAGAALLLVLVPLLWALGSAVAAGADSAAWQMLLEHPQTMHALGLSLWTGLAATLLATWITAHVLGITVGKPDSPVLGNRLTRLMAPLLAVPHAAFAIGAVALLAPSGWLMRLTSPWLTGLDTPPPWPTTQDPLGLGLIAVLVLKEIPFLLWAALAHLQRPDVALRLARELRLAHTMGYSARAAWWRVGWPQLLPRMTAPLLAVLAYSLTVVDVALVIGPTSPPTLGMLAWQWLQDADAGTNALGAAAAWLLAACLAICAGGLWAALRPGFWRASWTRGLPPVALAVDIAKPNPLGALVPTGLLCAYGFVMMALLLGSVAGSWPFPELMPQQWTLAAWQGVLASSSTLWTTAWLAATSAAVGLLWVVVWLEWAPEVWRRHAQGWLMLPLVLPAVLWVVGLHRFALAWSLDATGAGLWLAHTLACMPYMLIALQGPYLGFDTRLSQVSATMGHGRGKFLLKVKWPLLRSALTASFAIGFAVSVAQYLPTLYVGAGRYNTVTTEAVTLASGGQRSLTAAFAWLQWMLPVVVFAVAARLGRPRRFNLHNLQP